MSNSRLPNSLFVMLVSLGAGQSLYYSQRMPESIASHFAKGGLVNAWQSKTAFYATELAIIVVATIIAFGVPRIVAAMSSSLINLPNKDFWLSPERREQTGSYFGAQFAWLGCALLAFLLFVMELVSRANLRKPPQLDTSAFVPAILAFLAFVVAWGIHLARHFSRPRD